MKSKILVCAVESDKIYLNKIRKWGRRKKFGNHEVSILGTDDRHIRSRSGRLIRPRFEKKLKEVDFIIILVGAANDRHPWIRYEHFATEHHLTRFYMRIPYTNKENLPNKFQTIQQIAYNPNAIDKLLRLKESGEDITNELVQKQLTKIGSSPIVVTDSTETTKIVDTLVDNNTNIAA